MIFAPISASWSIIGLYGRYGGSKSISSASAGGSRTNSWPAALTAPATASDLRPWALIANLIRRELATYAQMMADPKTEELQVAEVQRELAERDQARDAELPREEQQH